MYVIMFSQVWYLFVCSEVFGFSYETDAIRLVIYSGIFDLINVLVSLSNGDLGL